MGPTILGLQQLELTCGLPTWRSLRNQYRQLFAPAGLPKIELDFRINQFARWDRACHQIMIILKDDEARAWLPGRQ